MRQTVASSAGNQDIAGRYARAFFALAKDQSQIDAVSADFAALKAALAADGGLVDFLHNPVLKRMAQAEALKALAAHLKFSALTAQFLGTLALRRRLPALPQVIGAVESLIAQHKGEVTAEVTAAQALDQSQIDAIAQSLKKSLGAAVRVDLRIDPEIMGGLVIRVGSRLIDSSVRTKLERLHRTLKTSSSSSDQKKMKEVA
jgi:F-type H+-transporting ATPase subunit delta